MEGKTTKNNSIKIKTGHVKPDQLFGTFGPGAIYNGKRVSSVIQDIDLWDDSRATDIFDPGLTHRLGVKHLKNFPDEIPAKFFPEYYICRDCGRLFRVNAYFENYDSGKGPLCPDPECPGKLGSLRTDYILACKNGHLEEFPWSYVVHRGNSDNEKKDAAEYESPVCSAEELYVDMDFNNSESVSMKVYCKACGAEIYLSDRDIQEMSFPCRCQNPHNNKKSAKICSERMHPLRRDASNVYLPVTLSNVTLPSFRDDVDKFIDNDFISENITELLLSDLRGTLEDFYEDYYNYVYMLPSTDEEIKTFHKAYDRIITEAKTQGSIEYVLGNLKKYGELYNYEDLPEMEHFLIQHCCDKGFRNADRDEALDVTEEIDHEGREYFSKLIGIHALNEVTALIGFTRIEPSHPTTVSKEGMVAVGESNNTCPDDEFEDTWLPAVKAEGEGIFFELNRKKINEWDNRTGGFEISRRILLHTLTHFLAEELASSAGYDPSSIKKRIYNSNTMCGVLIYVHNSDYDENKKHLYEYSSWYLFSKALRQALKNALDATKDTDFTESPASLNPALIVPAPGLEDEAFFTMEFINSYAQFEVPGYTLGANNDTSVKKTEEIWLSPLLGEVKWLGDKYRESSSKPYLDEYNMLGLLEVCNIDLENCSELKYIRSWGDELEEAVREQAALKLRFGEAGYGINKREFVIKQILEKIELRPRDASDKKNNAWKEKAKARSDGKLVSTTLFLDVILEDPTYIIRGCLSELVAEKDRPAVEYAKTSKDENRSELAANAISLYNIEEELMNCVTGQEDAVETFIRGLSSMILFPVSSGRKRGPAGIFLLAGPPGVGKTLLATTLATSLGYEELTLDMSGFSRGRDAVETLTGFDSTFVASHEGILTGFVDKNPKSIVIFDEIEKAAAEVILELLPMLDRGIITDRFYHREISFSQTICIFTTNAGRSLYDGNRAEAGEISREVILEALQTENKPGSNEPFFPPEICSRLATGTLIMFRHLSAANLTDIAFKAMHKCADTFHKFHDIEIDIDSQIPGILLLRDGGESDARKFRKESEDFIESEIYKLTTYIEPENMAGRMSRVKKISFVVDGNLCSDPGLMTEKREENQKPSILVYVPKDNDDTSEINILKNEDFEHAVTEKLASVYNIDFVNSYAETTKCIIEKEYLFALSLAPTKAEPQKERRTDYENLPDKPPLGSRRLQKFKKEFLQLVKDECPNLPVYVFYTTGGTHAFETEVGLLRSGAGRVILVDRKYDCDNYDFDTAVQSFDKESNKIRLEREAVHYACQRKALRFETKPKMNGEELEVHLCDFKEIRNISGSDRDAILYDETIPSVSFDDVIGATDAIEELKSFVEYLKNPKKYCDSGLTPPKGVLLYGPPGTGKTYLAEALAHETDVAYFPINGGDLAARGVPGVEELFNHARRYSPAVIFIDEIDAVGKERTGYNFVESTLNKLLSEMDGFDADQNRPVFVMAATNFPLKRQWNGQVILDEALLRRFDRRIMVDRPKTPERKEYLKRRLEKFNYSIDDKDLENIAKRTVGYNFPQIDNVVQFAARQAMTLKADEYCIDYDCLSNALEEEQNGTVKERGEADLLRTARHEAGHACLSCLVNKVPSFITIIARGNYNGYVMTDPDNQEAHISRRDILNEIMIDLGGRAAEQLYYGIEDGITTGASADLNNATGRALDLVLHYGMDEKEGMGSFPDGEISENTKARVNEILEEQLDRAGQSLHKIKPLMDKMVEGLLSKKTLGPEDMMEIMGINTTED